MELEAKIWAVFKKSRKERNFAIARFALGHIRFLRKQSVSVEKLLRDYENSDNALMNNPYREKYESAFDL